MAFPPLDLPRKSRLGLDAPRGGSAVVGRKYTEHELGREHVVATFIRHMSSAMLIARDIP